MKKLIPILLAVFALASCEKDPDMGKLDDNYLVYTNHDEKADFKVPTFYLHSRQMTDLVRIFRCMKIQIHCPV